ncbi:MAG: MBL fold metallo-hydrolase [Candidatus Nanoarchaeia archaeon]|nr:MBL fold metallo-hydrolase [Candidatus Nanoarchaeia archaeon]
MKTKKLSESVWKINGPIEPSSNCYLIIREEPILIDPGNNGNSDILLRALDLIGVPASKIKHVIYTHLHYDHIGNPKKFPHAKFYASEQEILSYRLAPEKACLKDFELLTDVKLLKVPEVFYGLKTYLTPGHTRGSICLWFEEDAVLFTGDTLFKNGTLGRTDLPTSLPWRMKESITKLAEIPYVVLAPGHDNEDVQ